VLLSIIIMKNSLPDRGRQALALAGWIALSFSAALSGVLVSADGWYADLAKPEWNPPSWVFGPVWTTLYVMMGVAAWLVWREGGWKERRVPLTLFVVQWLLNALWTPLFFGLHLVGWASVEIAVLWFAVAVTMVAFWRVKAWAGILFLPYFLWVTLATVLNFTIWKLNA